MKKRFLSILTALCLTLTLLPTAALADEGDGDVQDASADVATQVAASLPEPVDGVITLTGDITVNSISLNDTGETTIDLNGHTLTYIGGSITPSGNQILTITDNSGTNNGTFKTNSLSGANALFNPEVGGTVNASNVTIDTGTTGTAFYPRGSAAAVNIDNSTIKGGYYCVATNSSGEENYGVVITLTDSSFVCQSTDFDNCAIMLNVAGTLNIDDCNITGDRQAVFVRAGDATISNSEITVTGKYTGTTTDWNDGNNVPEAALIVGNYYSNEASAYLADADVALINTTVTSQDTALQNPVPALYFDGNTSYNTNVVVSGNQTDINGTINDGTQTNENAINVMITGGTFDNGVDISAYLPSGMTQDNGAVVIDTNKAVATVDSTGAAYDNLKDAIEAAPVGATVTLVANAVLDASGKNDGKGALTITKDIILDGGNYTITAKNVTLDEEKGPSMINVQGNAKVTIKNVTINGKASGEGSNATKHGINIYGADVTLQNVEVQNNRWYAVVNNGGNLTVNGLKTTGNQWGINMDNRASASSLNITTASISEASSIVFDKTNETQVTATISGGNYQYIVMNSEAAKANTSLTISGGTYGTGSISNSVNIADYLASGLSWNPSTGAVYDPSQNQSSSGSSSDPSYSPILDVSDAVSYTHLTLPTIYSV